MLDKIKFAKLMLGLGEIYDKQISEFMADIYYDVLKQYDYPAVEQAIRKVIAIHKYQTLPKPAEIFEFLEYSQDDRALLAWLQVKEAISKAGYYQSVEFADPIISNIIMELGGWMELCCSQKDEMPFIEKRFKDLYRLMEKREIKTPIKLVGFIESKNYARGYLDKIPEPIKIGFDNKQIEYQTAKSMAQEAE